MSALESPVERCRVLPCVFYIYFYQCKRDTGLKQVQKWQIRHFPLQFSLFKSEGEQWTRKKTHKTCSVPFAEQQQSDIKIPNR